MDRQPPRTTNDEIDLYMRTYYSLLRSSGEVRVRAFEEPHSFCDSSLHAGARDPRPDIAAFGYSAARLPACMVFVRRIVMGQSHEHFEAAGLRVREWQRVRTRGRRRPLRWDGQQTLAAFITSTSDIDDLVPILTAYQMEWNKLHEALSATAMGRAIGGAIGGALAAPASDAPTAGPAGVDALAIGKLLDLSDHDTASLRAAFGAAWDDGIRAIASRASDLLVRLLNGSYSQYQRAAQRWWSGIEPSYVRPDHPRRPAVYFVSSNTHSLINLLGGYAGAHRDQIIGFARAHDPEQLAGPLDEALRRGDQDTVVNLTYYLLRAYLHHSSDPQEQHGRHDSARAAVQAFDAESGIVSLESPGRTDVSAQRIEIASLRPERMDPRILQPGMEVLARSDAVILNIDYPLGMAAYHHLSRLAQGVGEIRGIYVMGKAATLNGRVGDVMIPTVVHDEHSKNTYLFRNCFAAQDVQPFMRHGTVLDNQKALTVRSAFLQNRDYMSVFYREGYTILEMESGPYLSAIYEIVNANRHPNNEIVHLSNLTPFEVGLLHYASDTPYSRRQSLLSRSLSYFGVDSTYGCAIAIAGRILRSEIARHAG